MRDTDTGKILDIVNKLLSKNEYLIRSNANLETMLNQANALLDEATSTIARNNVILADRKEFMTIMSKAKCTYAKNFKGEVISYRFDLAGEGLNMFQKRLKRLDLSVD